MNVATEEKTRRINIYIYIYSNQNSSYVFEMDGWFRWELAVDNFVEATDSNTCNINSQYIPTPWLSRTVQNNEPESNVNRGGYIIYIREGNKGGTD